MCTTKRSSSEIDAWFNLTTLHLTQLNIISCWSFFDALHIIVLAWFMHCYKKQCRKLIQIDWCIICNKKTSIYLQKEKRAVGSLLVCSVFSEKWISFLSCKAVVQKKKTPFGHIYKLWICLSRKIHFFMHWIQCTVESKPKFMKLFCHRMQNKILEV